MPRIAPKALKDVVPKVAIKASRSPRTIKAPAFFKQTKRLKKKAFPRGIPFQAMSIGEKKGCIENESEEDGSPRKVGHYLIRKKLSVFTEPLIDVICGEPRKNKTDQNNANSID